jgi:hypothetical protein
MRTPERRAWFQLGVVGLATFGWLLMFAILGSAEVAMVAFALLALTALPAANQARACDERDRAIAEAALNLALRCWFVLSAVLPLAAASRFGWDRPVPLRILAQGGWLAWIVVVLVRSAATIYMYRSSRYA